MVKEPRKLPLALINSRLQSCMLKPFICTSLVLDVKTLFEKVASFTPFTFPPAHFTPLHAFPVLSYSGMLLALINSMHLLVIRRYY